MANFTLLLVIKAVMTFPHSYHPLLCEDFKDRMSRCPSTNCDVWIDSSDEERS